MLKPGFTGSPLDRLDHVREDAEAFASMRSHPEALLLRLDGLDPVTDQDRLAWTPLGGNSSGEGDIALLGMIEGKPRFVTLQPGAKGSMARQVWQAIGSMPPGEAGTYAAARSLVDWHARHRFCAVCGTATAIIRAGWARRCPGCAAEHFPRTDPVVIMIAEYDDKVLVGRQPRFPPRNYSALAGFIEVGESIEEAVARELYEEAGVRARNIRYVTSQPWPFPSSLMIACIADAESDVIALDTRELENAIWVSREDVRAALAQDPSAPFAPPPPLAIANTLLTHWSRER